MLTEIFSKVLRLRVIPAYLELFPQTNPLSTDILYTAAATAITRLHSGVFPLFIFNSKWIAPKKTGK